MRLGAPAANLDKRHNLERADWRAGERQAGGACHHHAGSKLHASMTSKATMGERGVSKLNTIPS